LLNSGRTPPTVVVEMHPGAWPSLGDSPGTAAELLRELKLRPLCLSGQADGLAEHGIIALEPA
jgi:hypothetical protein